MTAALRNRAVVYQKIHMLTEKRHRQKRISIIKKRGKQVHNPGIQRCHICTITPRKVTFFMFAAEDYVR
jgi:hypothetical protein